MDRLAKVYECRNEPDGRVRVLRVPIYAEHVRTRQVLDYESGEQKAEEIPFDRDWLERAVADARKEQEKGHTPPLHLRHNFGTALASTGTPTEPVGTFENLELADVDLAAPGEEPDVKAVVFSDLVYHDAEAFAQSKRYPHRSVEVYDYREPRINSLALLGSEEPYFRFPNLRVREAASLALVYRRGAAVAVRWEDKSMPKPEPVQAVSTPAAPVVAAAPKVEGVAPAPAPVASNAPPVPAAAPAPTAPAQPAAPQGDQTAAVLQQILAAVTELKAAMTGGPGAGAPQAPGAGSVAPVASAAAPVSEGVRVVAEAVRAGATNVTAVANGDLLKLETEKLVLSQKVARLERREAARGAIEKLEQEGHLVGPELRLHFERIADANEPLESHVALARLGAPKTPPRFSDVSAAASQGEGLTDAPEVVAAGALGSASRERARRLASEHAHLVKRGVVNSTLARFLEIETKADQGNAKARASVGKRRSTPST